MHQQGCNYWKIPDGHRKAIVEHTLNVLLLPGIHRDGITPHRIGASSESLFTNEDSPISHSHFRCPPISPALPIPGTSLTVPSPLHFTLRIITRLSFNEQGLVTHHRDIWDVKDVIGLVPGVSLAQWIGTRLAAVGLSYAAKFIPKSKGNTFMGLAPPKNTPISKAVDLEVGMRPSVPFSSSTTNTLREGDV